MCPCGSKFDIQHSMGCKNGGFLNMIHNDLRNLTTKILSEVYYDTNIEYYDTEIEPKIVPLSGEDLSN